MGHLSNSLTRLEATVVKRNRFVRHSKPDFARLPVGLPSLCFFNEENARGDSYKLNYEGGQMKPLLLRLLFSIMLSCTFFPGTARGQITIGLIRSVHLIRYGQGSGTCFTLTVRGKQYLITAGHVVEGIKAGGKVGIYQGGAKWQDFIVNPIPVRNPKIDIAVLSSQEPVTDESFWLEAGSVNGLNLVQEVYFLGFPYGGTRSVGGRTLQLFSILSLSGISYPAALVKRGIIAGFDSSDPGSPVFYVDAMNNPGFSGSPVVFYDKASNAPKVIGVVSARVPEDVMTPIGVPPPPVGVNSGIVVVHDISGAIDAINDYLARK
jgi:hypothetical protein